MPDFLVSLLHWSEQWLLALRPSSLFLLSFVESIFFPIPPDAVLLPLSLYRPELAPWFGVVATVGSVAGAVVGYGLGLWGGRPLLKRVASAERIAQVEGLFNRYDAWAIGIAGFTPVPYKVFAIAAGVFRVPLHRFVVVSLLSRGARFMMGALLVMAYGEDIVDFLRAHFEWVTVAIMAVVIGLYAAWSRIRGRKKGVRP